MKPSNYHYIKRMCVRNLYKKRKRKSIFTLPFRMILFPYKISFNGARSAYNLGKALSKNKNQSLYGNKFNHSERSILGYERHKRIDCFMFFIISITIIGAVCCFSMDLKLKDYIFLFITYFLIFCWIFYRVTSRKIDINKELKKAKDLSDKINTTTNEYEFEKSMTEIKETLKNLSKYEKYGYFTDSTPSDDLKRIEKDEKIIREKFNERNPNRKMSKYEIERYAMMCNAYLDRQDEMELYK